MARCSTRVRKLGRNTRKLGGISRARNTKITKDKPLFVQYLKNIPCVVKLRNKVETLINEKDTEFRLKGRDMLRFSALVKMEGSEGWVEFDVTSKHGGTDKKRINITLTN